MRHAAAFYALFPLECLRLRSPLHTPSRLCRVHTIKSKVTSVSIGFSYCMLIHLHARDSSVTLTESALSSPRAAAPGAAALSRSARARSFFNRPAFTPLCSRLAYPAATAEEQCRDPNDAFRR